MDRVAKTWHLQPLDRVAQARLAGQLNISPVIAALLLNRGLRDPDICRQFLSAPWSALRPPETLPGASVAAERLWAAVQAGRSICVYGDYDADGVTGTSILFGMLKHVGATVQYHVPSRFDDGYGLNAERLRLLAESGVQLVVSVDCGITAVAEAEEAKRLGLELIITDHHEFKASLPDAAALVHPRLPGTQYGFDHLCGAGVAFKVAWLLAQKASGGPKVDSKLREFLLDAVALAAIGLVADVVPLHDENRIFVRFGLDRMRKRPTPGLAALIESSKLGDKPLRATDIGFRIAPRINAAGRLGLATMVVELLTTVNGTKAKELARFLDDQNSQRQVIERQIVREARERLTADVLTASALVLADPAWHQGVVGIVAGRLADLYGRPTLIISIRDGVATGSGRSIPGFALHEALAACGDHLLSYGGHAAAAGFRIDPARIDGFREAFCAHAAKHFPDGGPAAPRLVLDAEVPLSALTLSLVDDLNSLEPYGAMNPKPQFLAGDLEIAMEPRHMGQGERHFQFRVKQGGTTLRAVVFNQGERIAELQGAGRCCLAFTPEINDYQGYRSVELHCLDWQAGAEATLG